MGDTEWFLTADERGNTATELDRRHRTAAWTSATTLSRWCMAHLFRRADCRLASGPCRRPGAVHRLARRSRPAARRTGHRGVARSVRGRGSAWRGGKGLVWRSHLDRLSFSEQQNRHLGEDIEAAGGECLLDQRVRPGRFAPSEVRRPAPPGPPRTRRRLRRRHRPVPQPPRRRRPPGDPQKQPMAEVYGDRPPWHDIQLAVRGPAVADVEATFRERWEDPAPLTRNPVNLVSELLRRDDRTPGPLPDQLPDPAPAGTAHVQLLRTYGNRRRGYPFAPTASAASRAPTTRSCRGPHSLIYVEDQYLWSREIVRCFADALRADPRAAPDRGHPAPPRPGRPVLDAAQPRRPPAGAGRAARGRAGTGSPSTASRTTPARRSTCTPRSASSTTCGPPVGSDNINRRSWTHDSELSMRGHRRERDERAARRRRPVRPRRPAISPATCASNSPASTSTAPRTTTPT